MRAALDQIRATHHDVHAGRARGSGSVYRGGKFRDGDAFLAGLLDMRNLGVVMAGQRQLACVAGGNNRCPVRDRITLLMCGESGNQSFVRRVIEAAVTLGVAPVFGEVAPLALAGRVVHQADQLHQSIVSVLLKHRHDIGCRDFAAKVQQMLDPQQALIAAFVQSLYGDMLGLAACAALVHVANHNRVQHRGDACRRTQRIVHHRGGMRVPEHARTRHQVFFKVVGVQLDQAGQQPVAGPVLGTRRSGVAALDGLNNVRLNHHAAGEFLRRGDNFCVPDDSLRHKPVPVLKRFSIVFDVQAAARDRFPHFIVMENAHHCGATRTRCADQFHHNTAVVRVQ